MGSYPNSVVECQRLAKTIRYLGGRASACRIAKKLAIAVKVVFARLRTGASASIPFFAFDNLSGVWGVTAEGNRLAKAPGLPGFAGVFAGAPPYVEPPPRLPRPSPLSALVTCPACEKVRPVCLRYARKLERHPHLPRTCRRCCDELRFGARPVHLPSRDVTCPDCKRTRTVSPVRAMALARYPHLPRRCRRCSGLFQSRRNKSGSRRPVRRAPETADERLAPDPRLPSDFPPGTPGRIAVVAARARLRLPLVIPGDAGCRAGGSLAAACFAEMRQAGRGRAEGRGDDFEAA